MGWIALGGIFSKMQGCRHASVVGLWLWSVKLGLGHLPRDTRVFIQADNSFFPLFVTHTHTGLTALFPGLPRWAGTRKVKPIRILLEQETMSGSGISWAICKSAPCSRQITTPAPHHSGFYRPDALPAAQPTVSKHCQQNCIVLLTFFTKEIFNI